MVDDPQLRVGQQRPLLAFAQVLTRVVVLERLDGGLVARGGRPGDRLAGGEPVGGRGQGVREGESFFDVQDVLQSGGGAGGVAVAGHRGEVAVLDAERDLPPR